MKTPSIFRSMEAQQDTHIAKALIAEAFNDRDPEELYASLEDCIIRAAAKRHNLAQRNLLLIAQLYHEWRQNPIVFAKIKDIYSFKSEREDNGEVLTRCVRYILADYPASRKALPLEPEGRIAKVLAKSLGELKFLATQNDPGSQEALLHATHPAVITALCQNPRIKENQLIFIASRQPTLAETLLAVLQSNRIFQSSIREALAHNPYLPAAYNIKLLPTLNSRQMQSVRQQSAMHRVVHDAAEDFLALTQIAF